MTQGLLFTTGGERVEEWEEGWRLLFTTGEKEEVDKEKEILDIVWGVGDYFLLLGRRGGGREGEDTMLLRGRGGGGGYYLLQGREDEGEEEEKFLDGSGAYGCGRHASMAVPPWGNTAKYR